MKQSVGWAWALSGVIVASSVVAIAGSTVGLRGLPGALDSLAAEYGEREEASQPNPSASSDPLIGTVTIPVTELQPGERIVSTGVVRTVDGPVPVVTIETPPRFGGSPQTQPAAATSSQRTRRDDDSREHESREHDERRERR